MAELDSVLDGSGRRDRAQRELFHHCIHDEKKATSRDMK